MSRDRREWGVRLGDVRVSRHWPISVFAAAIVVRRRDRQMVRRAERIGRDIGESVVVRWHETGERTEALIDPTRTLKRLTGMLRIVAVATLAVAVWALVRG
jgi:hypothetical protein